LGASVDVAWSDGHPKSFAGALCGVAYPAPQYLHLLRHRHNVVEPYRWHKARKGPHRPWGKQRFCPTEGMLAAARRTLGIPEELLRRPSPEGPVSNPSYTPYMDYPYSPSAEPGGSPASTILGFMGGESKKSVDLGGPPFAFHAAEERPQTVPRPPAMVQSGRRLRESARPWLKEDMARRPHTVRSGDTRRLGAPPTPRTRQRRWQPSQFPDAAKGNIELSEILSTALHVERVRSGPLWSQYPDQPCQALPENRRSSVFPSGLQRPSTGRSSHRLRHRVPYPVAPM